MLVKYFLMIVLEDKYSIKMHMVLKIAYLIIGFITFLCFCKVGLNDDWGD